MVLIGFGCFASFWASLVVVALAGIEWEKLIFGCHWFLIYVANFWVCFVIVAAAHFCFCDIPFISFQKTNVGHSGNEWERVGNVWVSFVFDNSCQFLG